MATLVLTVVGGVIGGPIGASIGALAGQAIDANFLFKPKGRQGPRLTELAVQTSSYGAPLPKLFGTLRVAGSVIWSTDLIESRGTRGAKGQPDVTTYSYAVSFAVALSARPITGVGRIWADGKLLRGVAGDFKTPTGFRLHLGGEDQAPDPLIAAAEGATPAYRGLAYAVFEQFQLADYGNRIPSLTFEVIADDAPVPLGTIAATLSDGVVGGGTALALPGFSAYGDSVRGVLETLAEAGGGWFAPVGAGLEQSDAASVAATLTDEGYAARSSARRRTRSIKPIERIPKSLAIAHYDPARDYQAGRQVAVRPGAGARSETVEIAAALDAAAARALAEAALARAEAERERRQLALSLADLAIAPGMAVAIAGNAGAWRVTAWSLEAMVLTLDLVRLAAAGPAPAASSGRVLASADEAIGATLLVAAELPPLDDTLPATPRLLAAAAGTAPGWRRASLLLSTDGGARFDPVGGTALPAVIGTIAVPPRPAGSALIDREGVLEILFPHDRMELTDADATALDAGANLALAGAELLQFGSAQPLGGNRWRLSQLLRGRRGTEAAAGTQRAGDRFVLLERDTLAGLTLPLAVLGGEAVLLAAGQGDRAPVEARTVIDGASLLPPAPVHLRLDPDGVLRWARRSRAGWRWLDGADAPLGEEAELYRVRLPSGAVITRTVPFHPLPADERHGLIEVRQQGSAGLSPPARLLL